MSSLENLTVKTPERVAFDYQVAGLGSRFVAMLIDSVVLLLGLLIALGVVLVTARATGSVTITVIIAIILALLIVFGYFWASETFTSGYTVGKYAIGLRVVDDRGGPLTFSQSGIRNLVRLVDFMPPFYGVGVLCMFISASGKRLGDFAAGTIVIRERGGGVRLSSLASGVNQAAELGAPRLDPADAALVRSIDAPMRKFLTMYDERAPSLDGATRVRLATVAADRLQQLVPGVFQSAGPLAALDRLAWMLRAEIGG